MRKSIRAVTQALRDSDRCSIGYICAMPSEELGRRYPDAPLLAPGQQVFVLHDGDGKPIMIADSRESVLDSAALYRIELVSVH
jgi:hypothetical protein